MARTREERELDIASAPITDNHASNTMISNKLSLRRGLYLFKSSIAHAIKGWMGSNGGKMPYQGRLKKI